jgi:predicted dehydrogenase
VSARVRVGLIGAGTMGSLHARVIAASDRSDLTWVSDPHEVSGRDAADRFGSRWVPEPDLGSVDAVVIAAPTQFHHALACQVIDAGLPLLVEKPVADTYEHCVDIVERADAAGVPLMCGLLERFNPAVRTVNDIVEGPVHVAAIRNSPYVERIRTGVASDLLIHDVDMVMRLFGGEPVSVAAQMSFVHPRSEPHSEDLIDASLRFEGGRVGTLNASRLSQRKVRSVTVTELDRLIEVDLLRQDITIYRNVDALAATEDGRGYRQQTIIEIPVIRHIGEPLALQWAAFLELLGGDGDLVRREAATVLPPHRVMFEARDAARA